MEALLICLVGVGALSLLLTLVTHAAVGHVRRRNETPRAWPAVSILKPLKGVEPGLYENLVSVVRQDYPEFEVLFGCESATDPALRVARQVQREFPHVRIKVVCGAPALGLNPKVNNLRMLSERASHDWALISDSNVRVRADYLSAMVAELNDAQVGLVSSLLVGSGERSFGARLDNLHMNSFIVRAVCGADAFAAHPCVIGKSMLFRLSALERLGGFELVDDVLAEDYVIGHAFLGSGARVVLSAHPVEAVSVERTVPEFVARHVRWGQMRRHLEPFWYWLEPVQSPIPWFLAVLATVLLGANPAAHASLALASAAGLFLKLASDAALIRSLRGARLSPADFAAILVKDVLFIGIWLTAAMKTTVNWRGNRLRVGHGSRLFPVKTARRRLLARGKSYDPEQALPAAPS